MTAFWFPTFTADAGGNFITLTDNGITSISRDGKVNWVNNENVSFKTTDTFQSSNIVSIQADKSDAVYVSGMDGLLYALDAATGAVRWKSTKADGSKYIGHDGFVYVRSDKGAVHALNAKDGSASDKAVTRDLLNKLGIPSDGDGGLYVTKEYVDERDGKKRTNSVKDVDGNGNVKWTYTTPDSAYGGVSDLTSDDYGNVYFTDDGGNLYSLDRNGNERFILICNNSIGSGTHMYVSKKGELFSLNGNYGLIRLGPSLAPISVWIDGEEVVFPVEPRMIDGTTLVPMRAIFEKLGATVQWNNENRSITAVKGTTEITLKLDRQTALVNGKEIQLEASPAIVDGSTVIPLRFVSEALGARVSWDGGTRTINITTKK